jgi:error-prone DNA polymerase
MRRLRSRLHEGIITSAHLERLPDGTRVQVAGLVACRQRPETAKGFLFMTLEDEHGLANVIVRPQLAEQSRLVVRQEPFVIVDGVLQRRDATTNVLARRITPLKTPAALVAPAARSFH